MTFTSKKFLAMSALCLAFVAGSAAFTTKQAQANEAVAGIVGFVAGAIVGSALTQSQYNRGYYAAPRARAVYVQPRAVYRQPRVVYRQPRVVYTQPRAVYVHRSYGASYGYRRF